MFKDFRHYFFKISNQRNYFKTFRELKHSTDVRAVFLNNKILVTTDELKDIYLWDLEIPNTGASQTEASYQRQRNTCIRSLTGESLFVDNLSSINYLLINSPPLFSLSKGSFSSYQINVFDQFCFQVTMVQFIAFIVRKASFWVATLQVWSLRKTSGPVWWRAQVS